MIFQQIASDVMSKRSRHPRIMEKEEAAMKSHFQNKGIMAGSKSTTTQEKLEVIELAKNWAQYFGRRHVVQLEGNSDSNVTHLLNVGHGGVLLTEETRVHVAQTGEWRVESKVVNKVPYTDLSLEVMRGNTLKEVVIPPPNKKGANMVLKAVTAHTILQEVEAYLMILEKDARYVLAVKPYNVRDATLLTFPVGAVIALSSTKSEKGWLFGTYDGKTGSFPVEYVSAIIGPPTTVAIENARHSIKKGRRDSHRRVGFELGEPEKDNVSESGRDAGQKPRAIGPRRGGLTIRGKFAPPLVDVEILPKGKYSMLVFAKEFFRQGQERYEMKRSESGSVRGTIVIRKDADGSETTKKKKKKKAKGGEGQVEALDWSWSELVQLVKWTNSPIQVSLLKFESKELNKLAIECFMGVMKFMGDYFARGKTEMDVVHYLLLVSQKHKELNDEIYCHLIKQTTSNRSARADSCARGWRLLVVMCAYVQPTDRFERYLRSYLQATALSSQHEFQDQGIFCLRNLKQTVRTGGRRISPDKAELIAVVNGKYTKIQKLYLPGNRSKSIKINAVTIVSDVIQDMCAKMGVDNHAEYGIYIFTQNSDHGMLLRPSEYILDTTTILEKRAITYRIYFKKFIWFASTKLDTAVYVTMIFDQVLPDFQSGKMLVLEDMVPTFLTTEFARILCLIYKAQASQPSLAELLTTYPKNVSNDLAGYVKGKDWETALTDEYGKVSESLPPVDAMRETLVAWSKFKLFGSRFFQLEEVSDRRIDGPCLMAINKNGIMFLQPKTRATMLSYSFSEVVSTRRLGAKAERSNAKSGKHYVDLKFGNLMVQRVTRCTTRQGSEITNVISAFLGAYVEKQHQRMIAANPN